MSATVLSVVGARPNFMKIAPIHQQLKKRSGISSVLLHTGQHYDAEMSDVFFDELGLSQPDVYLGVGSGTHAEQTSAIMASFEPVLLDYDPDLVLVVGDVNSTIACALVASKAHVAVAHVEAGLRSFDRRMPEEINRLLTDQLADYLFVTESSAIYNLADEGIPGERIFFVGNVMIDCLVEFLETPPKHDLLDSLALQPGDYALVTMHRPSNVDDQGSLRRVVQILDDLAAQLPVVFPVHPRTRKQMEAHGFTGELESVGDLHLINPLGYLDFLHLMARARIVVTDSGGIQEETTFLGVPCLTVRDSTERPVTIELGTNRLVPLEREDIRRHVGEIMEGGRRETTVPPLWDGKAAVRIANILEDKLA